VEIKFKDVEFMYDNLPKKILSDINCDFKENTVTGISGASGSGKTTLVEIINALILPNYGDVEVGSTIINKNIKSINIKNLRKKIGLVFQFPEEQFFCSTVKEEIEFGIKSLNKPVKDVDKHIKDALLMVGLDDSYLDKKTYSLSGGEKRKIAIASILALNPKIIILDEPTIGLDNSSKENLVKIIKMLKSRYNKIVIIVSNDTDLLLKICDKIIILDNGKIVLCGNKYDVFKCDIEKYGLKKPKIIEFEQLVLKDKGIKLLYRDDINDLMKDVYRHVK